MTDIEFERAKELKAKIKSLSTEHDKMKTSDKFILRLACLNVEGRRVIEKDFISDSPVKSRLDSLIKTALYMAKDDIEKAIRQELSELQKEFNLLNKSTCKCKK